MNETKYLTIAEIQDLLKVSRRTVERWILVEGLPAVKVGRLVRIEETAFKTWVHQRSARTSTNTVNKGEARA